MTPPKELFAHERVWNLFKRVQGFWGDIAFHLQSNGISNKYRIDRTPSDFRIAAIWYKQDHRALEGLTHELLHLELFRLGYPVFETAQEGINLQFMLDANNGLQHQVMRPMFEEFGLDTELFESPRAEYSKYEQLVVSQIESLAPFEGVRNYTEKCIRFFELREINVQHGHFAKSDHDGVEWIPDASV